MDLRPTAAIMIPGTASRQPRDIADGFMPSAVLDVPMPHPETYGLSLQGRRLRGRRQLPTPGSG
jgi:hypothetical protein